LFQHAQDPANREMFQQQLAQNDKLLMEQHAAGNVDPKHLQQTVMGHLTDAALADGDTPENLQRSAAAFTQKLSQDGQITPEEMQQVVQSPTMKKQLTELAQKNNITDPNSLWGMVQQMAGTPQGIMQLGSMMLGIPLALYGIGNMNSPGGILAGLLGGGAIAHGIGAFGGQNLMGATSLYGQIPSGGGQAAKITPMQPPQPAPGNADVPAGPGPQAVTGLELATSNPAAAHKKLLQAAPDASYLFPNPDALQQFAKMAKQDPQKANQWLDSWRGPFNMSLSAVQKQQLTQAMAQPV
jgi:hypothetical protein